MRCRPETVLLQQKVSLAYGLSEQEAVLRLKRHGPNTLMAHPERRPLDSRRPDQESRGVAARGGSRRRRAFRGMD